MTRGPCGLPRWGALLLVGLIGCRASAGPNEASYVGSDFAFRGPDTLPPGPTTFRFKNAGTLDHELGLALLRPGVTAAQAFAAERDGAAVDSIYEADGLLYTPLGTEVDMGLTIDLQPGRNYVLICTLEDGPKETPHVKLGMFKGLVIRPR